MQELIVQALVKLAEDGQADGIASLVNQQNSKCNNLVSQKMLDHLSFNPRSHLLSLPDANMTDSQFIFLLEVLEAILQKSGLDGENSAVNQSIYQIKGLNFNGNHDLTDRASRQLTEFIQRFRSVKVLSIEKWL